MAQQKVSAIIIKNIDRLSRRVQERAKEVMDVQKRMSKAVDVIFETATRKRRDITMIGDKKYIGVARFSKSKGMRRVSDPKAPFGVPVRTGRLRESIMKRVSQRGISTFVGEVYSKLNYAQYVEYGTSKMAARPFIRPALDVNKRRVVRILSGKEE